MGKVEGNVENATMSDLIGGLSKLSSTVEELLTGYDISVGLLNCRWYLSEIELFVDYRFPYS